MRELSSFEAMYYIFQAMSSSRSARYGLVNCWRCGEYISEINYLYAFRRLRFLFCAGTLVSFLFYTFVLGDKLLCLFLLYIQGDGYYGGGGENEQSEDYAVYP